MKKLSELGGLIILISFTCFFWWDSYWILLISSNQGKTFRSAGWDFSIGGPQNTGTVKSAPKRPQVRERKLDVTYNQTIQRPRESGNTLNEFPEVSSGKGTRELYSNENQDNYHDVRFSLSVHCGFWHHKLFSCPMCLRRISVAWDDLGSSKTTFLLNWQIGTRHMIKLI